jgi:hypothetical protein
MIDRKEVLVYELQITNFGPSELRQSQALPTDDAVVSFER